jgi:hypothetical protein
MYQNQARVYERGEKFSSSSFTKGKREDVEAERVADLYQKHKVNFVIILGESFILPLRQTKFVLRSLSSVLE